MHNLHYRVDAPPPEIGGRAVSRVSETRGCPPPPGSLYTTPADVMPRGSVGPSSGAFADVSTSVMPEVSPPGAPASSSQRTFAQPPRLPSSDWQPPGGASNTLPAASSSIANGVLVDPWEVNAPLSSPSPNLSRFRVSESGRLHAPFADLAAGPANPVQPVGDEQLWSLDDELLARVEERERAGKRDRTHITRKPLAETLTSSGDATRRRRPSELRAILCLLQPPPLPSRTERPVVT